MKRPVRNARGTNSRNQKPVREVRGAAHEAKILPLAPRSTNAQLRRERVRLASVGKKAAKSANLQRKNEAARFKAHSQRRRVLWVSVISPSVVLILIVVATLTTPMLAIQRISIEGTQRLKAASILNALKPEIGTPLTLVNASSVSNALASFSLIESFAVIAKPPHTLVIRITERQPICIVSQNGVNYLYDPAGVRIGVAEASDVYPLVSIGGDPKTDAHFKQAMDVLLALPLKLLPRVGLVQARTKDDVRMQLRGSTRQLIIWGDGANSVLKSKVLSALLKHVKQNTAATIDVSSPTAPVVRYGNF
jgi:cell division protein FtsQ